MNDQLETALTVLVNNTMVGVDSAGEFLIAETPVVIEQLLMWYMIYKAILFGLGILSCILITWAWLWFAKIKEPDKSDLFGPILLVTIMSMMGLFFLINLEWLQIWIAPKVWLIEYVADLAGGK